MKSHFYTIIFLVCSLVGLRNNAMEETNMLLSDENKQNKRVEKNIMIQNIFNATHGSKRYIIKNSNISQGLIVRDIRSIFNSSLLPVETLSSVTSQHSKYTLLQEMVYFLLPWPVEVLLLYGVDPKIKGASRISPFEMLSRYKVSGRFKKKNFGIRKNRISNLSYSVRFAQCHDRIVKGEECWDHRKQCEFCNKLHGESNYMGKQNNNKNCEHCEGCFLCKNRLKKSKIVKKK